MANDIVWYDSDEVSAPVLNNAAGSLDAILYACLVTGFNPKSGLAITVTSNVATVTLAGHGYSNGRMVDIAGAATGSINGRKKITVTGSGSFTFPAPGVSDGAISGTITAKRSPLGWTRPYSGAGIGCYRQGGSSSTKRFLRVYDTNVVTLGYVGNMRGYENMTAVSTGTGAFPTTTQAPGNGQPIYLPADGTSDLPAQQFRSWVVIGTPRFFTIYWEAGRTMYGSSDVKNPISATSTGGVCGFMFGELANITKPADAFAHVCWGPSQADVFLPRSYVGSVSAVLARPNGSSAIGQGYLSFGVTYPSSGDSGLHLVGPVTVSEQETAGTLRGTLPGILTMFESPFSNSTSPPAFGAELTGIPGVTGRLKLLRNAYISYGDAAWLLDEDWGDI